MTSQPQNRSCEPQRGVTIHTPQRLFEERSDEAIQEKLLQQAGEASFPTLFEELLDCRAAARKDDVGRVACR